MRNLRLDICYDGTRYRGWQRLPGRDDTIQGKLETTLSRILDEPIEVSGSGRTDAGAHALHQAANFHCESAMPSEEILSKLRQYLPEDIGIYSCVDVPPRFHARLNARAKTYRYRIWNSRGPCVFQRRYVAVMPERLDLNAPVPCPPERPRQDLPLPYLEFPGAVRFSAAVRCGHAGTP